MKNRTMILFAPLTILLALNCAGNATVPPDEPAEPHPFREVVSAGDTIGWNGILLGMERGEIEALTDATIALERGEGIGCGEYFGEIDFAGRTLRLQMAKSGESYVLDSIFVELTSVESQMTMEELASQLEATMAVRYEESRHTRHQSDPPHSGLYKWTGNDDLALLIKPGRGYFVTRYGCLD